MFNVTLGCCKLHEDKAMQCAPSGDWLTGCLFYRHRTINTTIGETWGSCSQSRRWSKRPTASPTAFGAATVEPCQHTPLTLACRVQLRSSTWARCIIMGKVGCSSTQQQALWRVRAPTSYCNDRTKTSHSSRSCCGVSTLCQTGHSILLRKPPALIYSAVSRLL